MSENTNYTINLNQRQGYPMGSLFKKVSDREIQVEYRNSRDPKIGDQVKMWTSIRDMGSTFKVIAWQYVGTTREEGINKYRVIAESIDLIG